MICSLAGFDGTRLEVNFYLAIVLDQILAK